MYFCIILLYIDFLLGFVDLLKLVYDIIVVNNVFVCWLVWFIFNNLYKSSIYKLLNRFV